MKVLNCVCWLTSGVQVDPGSSSGPGRLALQEDVRPVPWDKRWLPNGSHVLARWTLTVQTWMEL